jgi:hypothetical protein
MVWIYQPFWAKASRKKEEGEKGEGRREEGEKRRGGKHKRTREYFSTG